MATHPVTNEIFHRENADAAYADTGARPGLGAAMIAIGVLASLVVLAFYLFNAT